MESTKALVIAPTWPTQSWFNKLLEQAVEQPMIIESKYLQLPGTNQKPPLYPKLKLPAVMYTRDQHKQAQFRKKKINVLNAASRDGTKNKYKYILRRWEKFCSERNYNKMQINTDIFLEFLTLEYNKSLSYNAIRNVLSTISCYLPHGVRHHNIIEKFMKGAFNLRPPKTQYHATWDAIILVIKLFAKYEYR